MLIRNVKEDFKNYEKKENLNEENNLKQMESRIKEVKLKSVNSVWVSKKWYKAHNENWWNDDVIKEEAYKKF